MPITTQTIKFDEVKRSKKVDIICKECGKIKKTNIKVSATINPWNINKHGVVKKYDEIWDELGPALENKCALEIKYGYICRSCAIPKITEWFDPNEAQKILSEMTTIEVEANKLREEYNNKLKELNSIYKEKKKKLFEAKIEITSEFSTKWKGKSIKGKQYLLRDLASDFRSDGMPYSSDYGQSLCFKLESWGYKLQIKDIKFI